MAGHVSSERSPDGCTNDGGAIAKRYWEFAMRIWIPLAVAMFLNAAANVLMKVGANTTGSLAQDASFMARVCSFLNVATTLGIALFAANVIFYRLALYKWNVSVAYPIMVSGGMILVTLSAVLLPTLGEKVSVRQVLGMVTIAGGVWLVAKDS